MMLWYQGDLQCSCLWCCRVASAHPQGFVRIRVFTEVAPSSCLPPFVGLKVSDNDTIGEGLEEGGHRLLLIHLSLVSYCW